MDSIYFIAQLPPYLPVVTRYIIINASVQCRPPFYLRDIGLPQQFKIDFTASDLKKYADHRLVAQKLPREIKLVKLIERDKTGLQKKAVLLHISNQAEDNVGPVIAAGRSQSV